MPDRSTNRPAGKEASSRSPKTPSATAVATTAPRPRAELRAEGSSDTSSSVQVVRRTLRIFEALSSAGGPLTLTELAKRVELHPSTSLRILRTLAADGYITPHSKPPTWKLGPALLRLKTEAGVQNDIRETARPFMSRLCIRIQQTIHLGSMLEDEVCYLEKIEPPDQGIVISSKVGARRPLHATSLGKALLAGMPAKHLEKTLDRIPLVRLTTHTITDREQLIGEIDTVRQSGYSLDRFECNLMVQCVGAPIRDATSQVTAALSASTFGIETSSSEFREIIEQVMSTAAQISEAIGCPPQASEPRCSRTKKARSPKQPQSKGDDRDGEQG